MRHVITAALLLWAFTATASADHRWSPPCRTWSQPAYPHYFYTPQYPVYYYTPPDTRPFVNHDYRTNPFYPSPYFYGPPNRGYYQGYEAGAALRQSLFGY